MLLLFICYHRLIYGFLLLFVLIDIPSVETFQSEMSTTRNKKFDPHVTDVHFKLNTQINKLLNSSTAE